MPKKLIVRGTVIFNAAQVTLNVEQVDVSGGCLIFNKPSTETAAVTCNPATPLQTPTGYSIGPDMPPVFIRGELAVGSGGSFVARQTFIMQPTDAAPSRGHPQCIDQRAGLLVGTVRAGCRAREYVHAGSQLVQPPHRRVL